ncbi:DEAD/DEAH box helicase [Limosilactobacillus reuteri]|uniref:DEAD/DEAH box helicase n=1 Tax=Limosilactobacillus reuteri TaxID=1598 RepID=UPI00207CB5FC|nr:DEAD/DEAH box helicase [Limosilactobacillus reuteri]MCO1497285.1 DEAD/DEAH box helicase [Limosilactobacillus reuteri]
MKDLNKTLGSRILHNIEQDEYLNKLYQRLLIAYSFSLLSGKRSYLKQKEYMDLLRFADLLSNSQNLKHSELHRNLAHKIIAMLTVIYPNSHTVLFYKNQILSNLNNYLQIHKDEVLSAKISTNSLINSLINDYKKEELKIPGTNKTFIGKQRELYVQLDKGLSSVSAPTSMGKTFLMIQFIASKIANEQGTNNFALVVPSRALITEITDKLLNVLKNSSIKSPYVVVNSNEEIVDTEFMVNHIFVVTPERLFYILTDHPKLRLGYVFIDESQKISEVSSRSTFYYQLFDIIDNWQVHPKVTFASPVVPNPQEYLKISTDGKNGGYLAIHESVVSQVQFIIDTYLSKAWIFNDLANKLIALDFVKLKSNTQIDVLEYFTNRFDKKMKNIVYPNAIQKAMSLSMRYADDLEEINDNELENLSEYIGNKLNPNYYLSSIVKKGTAFHIGRLPAKIRSRIENEYKEGKIQTLFCTSTLMEGVNLPADNVFVFDLKNGRREMSGIDFKNLIGRAGRLDHSMIGNSFLVTNPNTSKKPQMDDYLRFLKEPVGNQELSLNSVMTKNKLKQISKDLQSGNIDLNHVKRKSNSEYATLRKFTMIYLNDVDKGKKSVVWQKFSSAINHNTEQKITRAIKAKYNTGIERDINFSSDQSDKLKLEIQNDKLVYPEPILNGKWNLAGAFDLLNKMANIYNWKVYEKSDLGRINKDTGNFINLPDYTLLLMCWISGENLSDMISDFLRFKSSNIKFLERVHSNWNGSLASKNAFINLILDKINQVINFKLKNYFMKTTREICKHNNLETIDNDWYRYIEYGTISELRIWLQRHGYSRESTKFIEDNQSRYVTKISNGYLLSSELENVNDEDVAQESKQIRLFRSDIFLD